MRKDFHREDGHSSDLDQKRSGIPLLNGNHNRMVQSHRADDNIQWKRTPSLPIHEWKLSIHYCADEGTIQTAFRTIISIHQLSIYGALSDSCDECKSCRVRTGTIWPIVCAHKCDENTYNFWLMIIRKKIFCKSIKNEWTSYHNKIVWLSFVLMQDSWQRLMSDSISWQQTLKKSHNLQIQWLVVSFLCQEMKNHLTRKVGCEWTPKLGPHRKSQPAAYWVNMEWKLELNCVHKDNSHSWVRISHAFNKLITDLTNKENDNNEQKTSEMQFEDFALKTNVLAYASRYKA